MSLVPSSVGSGFTSDPPDSSPEQVTELQSFPAATFADFQLAVETRQLDPAVNVGIARHFLLTSNVSRLENWIACLLMWLPVIVWLAFIILVVALRLWTFLLALPLFVLLHSFALHSARALYGRLRPLTYLLLLTGAGYGLVAGSQTMLLLCVPPLVVWHAVTYLEARATTKLIEALTQDETLLCRLWTTDALMVRNAHGQSFRHPSDQSG